MALTYKSNSAKKMERRFSSVWRVATVDFEIPDAGSAEKLAQTIWRLLSSPLLFYDRQ